ncbi:MAG: hypothetical protein E6Q40_13125 [Cupriavidus sp.]|nr:MAG: hypothetical protein E6Q40_13125 [Cupriavidus sp.]
MLLSVGALLLAGSVTASNDPGASGRLDMVEGGVLVQRSVQTDVARVGTIVGVGDAILTSDTGTTQWAMADDSVFAMAPSSGLKINKYSMPNSGNPSGAASYTLLQGAVHTITGKIGRDVAANRAKGVYVAANGRFNPANLVKVAAIPSGPYILKTATAAITTKGADYAVVQGEKLLQVLVNKGSVMVCTIGGCASPVAGEGVIVNCAGCKPQVVPGITLGLDSLLATLEFKYQNHELVTGIKIENPRVENCSSVASQSQDGGCFPSGPTPPVSPN